MFFPVKRGDPQLASPRPRTRRPHTQPNVNTVLPGARARILTTSPDNAANTVSADIEGHDLLPEP